MTQAPTPSPDSTRSDVRLSIGDIVRWNPEYSDITWRFECERNGFNPEAPTMVTHIAKNGSVKVPGSDTYWLPEALVFVASRFSLSPHRDDESRPFAWQVP